MPLVPKRRMNCWFQAPVDAVIDHEYIDLTIISNYEGLKCAGEDVNDVIKSVSKHGDPELLYLLDLDLSQWKWHLSVLDATGDNFDCLVAFAAELTYIQGLCSVVIQSSDEQGGGVNPCLFHFVDLLRVRVVGDFHRFLGVDTPFADASWDRSFQTSGVHIAPNGGSTHIQIRANGVHGNVPFPARGIRLAVLEN